MNNKETIIDIAQAIDARAKDEKRNYRSNKAIARCRATVHSSRPNSNDGERVFFYGRGTGQWYQKKERHIIEDLRVHSKSLMSEIAERLPNVELKEWRNMVYKMVGEELKATGGRTYRQYELVNGRKEKK